MLNSIIRKLLSGRFIFTIITALVFGYTAYLEILTKAEILAVVMLVVSFYFNKKEGQG